MTTRRIAVISAGLSNPSSTRMLADRLASATVKQLAEREIDSEVDVFEFVGELGAPGGPDVFGLDESEGEGDFAEACAGGSLFCEDFVDVVGGEAAHLAEDLAHSVPPRRVHDALPRVGRRGHRCGGRATTCP